MSYLTTYLSPQAALLTAAEIDAAAARMREEILRDFPYHEAMPRLEDPVHGDRIQTLRTAARKFVTHPHYFMRVELYL